jgi:hypothetical protein
MDIHRVPQDSSMTDHNYIIFGMVHQPSKALIASFGRIFKGLHFGRPQKMIVILLRLIKIPMGKFLHQFRSGPTLGIQHAAIDLAKQFAQDPPRRLFRGEYQIGRFQRARQRTADDQVVGTSSSRRNDKVRNV